MSSFAYTPVHLSDAVETILREHGRGDGHGVRGRGESLVDLLIRIRLAGDDEIPRLFGRLRYGQLGALCAHLPALVGDEVVFGKVELGLLSRRCETVARGLCQLIASHCDLPGVMRVVEEVLLGDSWQELLPDTPDLQSGVSIQDVGALTAALARSYVASEVAWTEWLPQLSGYGVRSEPEASFASKLGGGIGEAAVLSHPGVFFDREAPETIRIFAKSLVSQLSVRALARGYLPSIPSSSWDETVLEVIVDLLSDPRIRPENWEGVSQEIQRQVVVWLNRHKLAEFFLRGFGDQRRFDFWEQFVEHMGPHSDGRVRLGQGFFEFPGFGVIEFMETGNAAHFYQHDMYMRLLRKRPYPANTGLKFRDQVISIYGQKCRIIHSGDWEWRWGPRVSALIRRGLTENRERD